MLPKSKAPQWAVAIAAALAVHSLLFLGYAGMDGDGAAGEGQGGIEIGLGLLGSMGEAIVDSDAGEIHQQMAGPIAQPKPPEPQPPDLPQPQLPQAQPEPQPTAFAPEPAQQLAEVAVSAKTSALAAALRRNKPGSATAGNPPSEGNAAGDSAVTQRRRSSGTGDSGSGGGTAGRSASYAAQLAARLNRHKHYPMAARRARQEGTVTLLLAIRRDGSLADFRISRSSGWDALDAAALRMLERAQPLPPFPASMQQDEFQVALPVSFSLTRILR
ncbi:MAG: TonB family protein [Gammaproteobacteria bacterium]|nr:TonB family protein [Gammaproteobacteria bacterium]